MKIEVTTNKVERGDEEDEKRGDSNQYDPITQIDNIHNKNKERHAKTLFVRGNIQNITIL